MSDYLIEFLAGSKEQEDLLWKMVAIAKKHSKKSELELSEIIRYRLQKINIVKGETLRETEGKSLEERIAFIEESIIQIMPLLELDNEETVVAHVRKVYRDWLAEQTANR